MTKIEWTEKVWNPTTGCDRVSPGCDHCYAMTMAKRLKGMGQAKYQRDGDPRTSGPGFGLTVHPDVLDLPLHWKKPQRIFVNSMSDLFHDGVSDEFIARVFAVMAKASQHTFQLLTKRHGRMRSLLNAPWFSELVTTWAWRDGVRPDGPMVELPLPNVWLGVSVENQQWAGTRIPALLETPAAVRWISAEPLRGPVDLRTLRVRDDALIDCLGGDVKSAYDGVVYSGTPSVLDWVVAGGESGPGARPMHPSWPRLLRDQCKAAGVAFLYKQWGEWRPQPRYSTDDRHHVVMPDGRDRGTPWPGWGIDQPDAEVMERVGKKLAGRTLDGQTWDQYPDTATLAANPA
jgi:protein gp37